jgi:ABC-type hemin transport system substrate-binding protein
VQARGDSLVKDLGTRQAQAIAKVKASKLQDLSAALWFSSSDLAADPYMAGKNGVAGYMMQSMGLRNVVGSTEEWPTVGWETIAKANPSILIIARMDRRRPADDYQKKLEFLKKDPVTQHMDAVKNQRIVIVDADALQGSIRQVDGMEQIAEAVSACKARPSKNSKRNKHHKNSKKKAPLPCRLHGSLPYFHASRDCTLAQTPPAPLAAGCCARPGWRPRPPPCC